MDLPIGVQTLPPAYGYDDVAIVPGDETINPDMTDVSTSFDGFSIDIPFMASAMDSVVDPKFAVKMSDKGVVLRCLIWMGCTRGMRTPMESMRRLRRQRGMRRRRFCRSCIRSRPIRILIGQRVIEIKESGGNAAVSFVPQTAKRHAPLAAEAGADMVVVQGTVITKRHRSKNSPIGLRLSDLVEEVGVPVVVGNTVTYSVTKELAEEGVHGILVGVGPGSACTSRGSFGDWSSAGLGDFGVRGGSGCLLRGDGQVCVDRDGWGDQDRW